MKALQRPARMRVLAALAALFLAACVRAAAAAEPAPPKLEAASLRVDWVFNPSHSPFFLARAKGWYRDAGIDLTINEGRGSGRVVQLVGNGSDTFGMAGADAVVRGVESGIPVVAVATIMPKGSDAVFVLAKSGITRPEALKGKTIGSTPGGTSDALLPAFLAGAGLSTDDVRIVPVEGAAKTTLLLQGKVDAINAVAWYRSRMEAAGVGAITSFPYADHGVEVVGFSLVTSGDAAKNRSDLVRRFVAVSLRAWDYARQHPDEALSALLAAAPEVARRLPKEAYAAEQKELLGLVHPAVAGKPFGTQSERDWEAMQRQLLAYHVIKATRPIAQYLTNHFVE
jgi:NitT/TauT family transport system substrate-binding protein